MLTQGECKWQEAGAEAWKDSGLRKGGFRATRGRGQS